MPLISVDINEVQKSITRPVVQSVVRDLYARLGQDASNIEIRMLGEGGAVITPGSAIDDDKDHRLTTDKQITIEYDEEYDETFHRSTPVIFEEHPYIFRDPTTKTDVRPVRMAIRGTINFRIHGQDKQEVSRMLRRYNRLLRRDWDQTGHKVTYSYDVPPDILMCLIDIYKLRESRAGYMEDWDTYMKKCFVKNQTVAYSMDGKNPVCKIQESGIEVKSYFDTGDEVPKKQADDKAGGYYAEFSIVVFYERVEAMTFSYPSVVHHQFLPAQWLMMDGMYALGGAYDNDERYYHYPNNGVGENAVGGNRLNFLSHFTYAFRGSVPHRAFKGIQDPVFNDWTEQKSYAGYQPFVRQVTLQLENDPSFVQDLGQFWHYGFSENAMEYIKATYDTINQSYFNVFTLTLYKEGKMLDQRDLKIDEDLVVRWKEDLDDRANYQVMYSICNDPSMLKSGAREALACHPMFFFDYLYLISPDIACKWVKEIEKVIQEADEDGIEDFCLPIWLTDKIWQDVWNCTNTRGLNSKGMKTVGIFDIISHRGKE